MQMVFSLMSCFTVQANQVGEVLRALGQNPTEADVRRLVQNQKTEGRVSFETFLPILQVNLLNKGLPTSIDIVGWVDQI